MYRGLGEKIAEYLQSIGINPIYAATLVGIIISASYIKYFKTWDEEPILRKWFVVCTFIGTGMLVLSSILWFLGYMNG